MLRVRFLVPYTNTEEGTGDYRSLIWPVRHPYWCSGSSDQGNIVVAFVENENELKANWPDAIEIDVMSEETEYGYTDRFAEPDYMTKELRPFITKDGEKKLLEDFLARKKRIEDSLAKFDGQAGFLTFSADPLYQVTELAYDNLLKSVDMKNLDGIDILRLDQISTAFAKYLEAYGSGNWIDPGLVLKAAKNTGLRNIGPDGGPIILTGGTSLVDNEEEEDPEIAELDGDDDEGRSDDDDD